MGFTTVIRAIADKGLATPEDFGRDASQSPSRTGDPPSTLSDFGLEMDSNGTIVSAALATRPTPHAISIRDKKLFAGCALDTLFIAGLLDEITEVESTCPVSETPIRLRVAPTGVQSQSVDPTTMVLSVLVPETDAPGPPSVPRVRPEARYTFFAPVRTRIAGSKNGRASRSCRCQRQTNSHSGIASKDSVEPRAESIPAQSPYSLWADSI